MNNGTPPGVRVLDNKQDISIRELYMRQLPEMRAAESKPEAYDAIKPLVYLAGLRELHTVFRELPPGGPVPERVAGMTPLTEQEVQNEIIDATCWWLGLKLKAQESGPDDERIEI